VLHCIIFITAPAQNVLLQHECEQWALMPFANSTFNNARRRAAHSLLMRHFSLSTYNIKINIIIVKHVTDFQWFCGFSAFLRQCMRYTVWIHCCKQPNYDFCISQGSVVTVLKCGAKNYQNQPWCTPTAAIAIMLLIIIYGEQQQYYLERSNKHWQRGIREYC